MNKALKKVGKCCLWIGAGFLLVTVSPYVWSPIYTFSEPQPFSGDHYYNPYQSLDTTKWLKANFHGHSKSWGGVTHGASSDNEYVAAYKKLGYDVIGLSNYHSISDASVFGQGKCGIYEHGFGITKNHHLVMGAKTVQWLDFIYYQNLNHKQYLINTLAADAELLVINHPKFSRGMYPEDLKYLSGYHCLEVLNKYRNSVEYWDAALSAGKPTFLIASDDVHNITKIKQLARRITIINSDNTKEAILSALKSGHAYGIDFYQDEKDDFSTKSMRLNDLVKPVSVNVTNDAIRIVLSSKANEIRFIGQGGVLKSAVKDAQEASYKLSQQDTYIRAEITALDGSVLYLNPIYKYSAASNTSASPVVDCLKTTIKRGLAVLIVLAALFYIIRSTIRHGRRC